MSQLLSVCVLAVFSTTVFASTPDLNQPSVQCVDTVTNEVVKKAETTSAAATTEQVKVVKKVRKFRKAAPVKLDLPELAVTGRSYLNHSGSAVVVVPTAQAGYVSGVNAAGEIVTYKTSEISSTTTITPSRKVTSDWAVTGLTKSTKSGQQVMVVPVAKPGYISAVTESGKIVMFQAPAKSTAAVATTTTTVTSNRKLVAASISTAAAPKTVVTKTTTVTTTAAPAITEQEVQQAAVSPAASISAEEVVTTSSEATAEVAATEETQQVVTVVEPRYKARAKDSYVMGVLGMQSTNASNVNSGIGINGAFGKYVLENVMIEAGLGFSKYSADVRNFTFVNQTDNFDINQYAAHVAAKYQFNNLSLARLVPVAGAILSYTYRQYGITNSQTNLNGGTGNSNAVDAGLVAGLDYQLSDAYAIGFDLKYMTNLSNNVNATYTNPTLGYVGSPVEQFQYYLAGLSMRMDF